MSNEDMPLSGGAQDAEPESSSSSDTPPALSDASAGTNQSSSLANLEGEKLFTVLLHNARSNKRSVNLAEAEKQYEQLIAYGQEWEITTELHEILEELSDVYFRNRKFDKSVKSFGKLFRLQKDQLGLTHPALASTEMMIGMCYHHLRDFELAVNRLRSASIRFQQSEEIDPEQFVECLCALASIYRDRGNFEAARTCIKQAYRVLPDDGRPDHLQCKVMEELAAALLSERRYEAAAAAYERVVSMKSELLKGQYQDIVTSLIDLGLCQFSLKKHDQSEQTLIRAGELYHQMSYQNEPLLTRLLETLAGVLRHQGQFVQAGVIEEYASELRGRKSPSEGHLLYGTLLEEAKVADARGDLDGARSKYREALCALELQHEIRAADRLAILARIYLTTGAKQKVQRGSLLTEIEDSVRQIFGNSSFDTESGLRRVALIYRLCGKPEIAAALSSIGDELALEKRLLTLDELVPGIHQDRSKLIDKRLTDI